MQRTKPSAMLNNRDGKEHIITQTLLQ